MVRRSVVLPLPFRPASVIRSPRSSLNETSANSGRAPTCFASPEAVITAMQGTPLWVLDGGGRLGRVLADLERGAAAAGGDDVRVVDRKPGALEAVDVVDLR